MKSFLLPGRMLVLGGAASGKSVYAETLAVAASRSCVYIATAQAWDAEMKDKIARHRDRRGPEWTTVEAPLALAEAIADVDPDSVLLVDCLSLWLSNLMLAEQDLDTAFADLMNAAANRTGPTIVVSNEVGGGIVPENALARRFRNAQGRLNQQVAQQSDCVVTVIAGLPLCLKGTAPEVP